MKRAINILRLLIAAVIATATLTACEQEQVEVKMFPTVQTIECEAGERPSFSFKMDRNWHISSNALWCTFLSSAGEVHDMSGGAGTHTITLRISDLDLKKEITTANITMKVEDREAVIVNVVRSGEKNYINIYDAEGNKLEGIRIGYSSYETFNVEANFRFAAIDIPEWVEIEGGSISGNAGERVEARARIVSDGSRERYAISAEDGHHIVFGDETGNVKISTPIIYDGMGGDMLTFAAPTSNTFGWEVSLEGKSFRQLDETTNEYVTFASPLQYTITAQDDDFEVVVFEKVIDCGIPTYVEGVDWIVFDKRAMTLSVKATDKPRYGLVLALPRDTYNAVKTAIKDNIFEMDNATGILLETLKYDFQKFVLIEFSQLDFEERGAYEGMYAYHSLTTYEIFCTNYDNAEKLSRYGVSEAYTAPFPAPIQDKVPGIIVDPRIEGWDTLNYEEGNATVELYYKGERLTSKSADYMVGENKEEVLALQLYALKVEFDAEVDILFKVNGEAKKLLVVTPPAK